MAASGFAGLGYQIVWTQQSALWLGHESAAVLAVVTAFFGGLALGSFALGARIERSRRPARWYAGCELLIALWGLVVAFAMSPFSDQLLALTGTQPDPWWHWTVAFVGTFALLLPATAAMGATLPAMERITSALQSEGERSIAPLYASNTLGAVIGVLAAAFWLIPKFGLEHTAAVCILLNAICSVASLCVFGKLAAPARPPVDDPASSRRAALAPLAITGFLGTGYEVLIVRVLSQVAEDTVYTFAVLLATYLAGSTIGAASYQRWLARLPDLEKTRDWLLCALASACLLSMGCLFGAEAIKSFALELLGPSLTAALSAEALLAVVAFGPPTLVMGALFSHLSRIANRSGVSFGGALALNTVGAACAPIVFGLLAFPVLGPKVSLLVVAVGYLALTAPGRWTTLAVAVPAAACVVVFFSAPSLAFIDVPEGGHVVSYRDGVMASVSVVEDADGVRRLRIDNRQQEGSNVTLRVDGRQGVLPLLLHPSPKHVLFLGLGTGITSSSAALDPSVQVDAVELLPEVIAASPLFTNVLHADGTRSAVHMIAADARRYVRTSTQRYDVIISDNFHPARSGSGSLYTVEHFQAVRERLAPDGLFCQWLPLHQLDLQTLRSIVRSFLAVYPQGMALLASNSLETPVIGLVASAAGHRLNIDLVHERLASRESPETRTALGIEDEYALLGTFFAGPQSLQHFAGNAALNTDDHPVVTYLAPRITYSPNSSPSDRLAALLAKSSISPSTLILPPHDPTASSRLAAYWRARDRFIELGRHVRATSDARAMLEQVREPLLASLRTSADFRPAYDPLLRMAIALSESDTAGARALLLELTHLQPARPEAQAELQRLN